jgi:hypothetical protein
MSLGVEAIFVALAILAYLVSPVMLVWGWVRWAGRPRLLNVASVLSFSGFFLANASALLAVSTIIYAFFIHGFAFYDPRLMRIFRRGILLSLGGLMFGIGGVWRRNSLRWHAPVCALGTLAFWVLATEGE